MKALHVVTGATGHVGVNLVRMLIKQGKRVRILVLPGDAMEGLEGLPVETQEGNVLDRFSLERAFAGADVVYHLASWVSIGSFHRKRIWQINVGGVQNVIQACLRAGVRRLVYVSSIHSFAEPPDGSPITETKDFDPEKVVGWYAKTKAEATHLVLQAVAEKDLDAVIVHPTGIFGPFDFKPSHTGQLIRDFMSGKLRAYMKGVYDYVDVRDVATGIILAAEKGRKGENYILSGEQVTVRQIMQILEEATGRKAPQSRIPLWIAKITAPFSELYYKVLKKPPLYTPYSIYTLSSNSRTSYGKAEKELGFQPRPIKQSIFDAVAWLQGRKEWLPVQDDEEPIDTETLAEHS